MNLAALPLPWVERLVELRGTRPAHTLLCRLNGAVRATCGDTHPCLVRYFARLANFSLGGVRDVLAFVLVRLMQVHAVDDGAPPCQQRPDDWRVSQLSRGADHALRSTAPLLRDYEASGLRRAIYTDHLTDEARGLIFMYDHGAVTHAQHLEQLAERIAFWNTLGGTTNQLSIPRLCAGDALLARRIRCDDGLRQRLWTAVFPQGCTLFNLLPRTAAAIVRIERGNFRPSGHCRECQFVCTPCNGTE
jgi:hypothetical protein